MTRSPRLLLPSLLLALLALPSAAQLFPMIEKAQFELALDRTAYRPGQAVELGAYLVIDDGWHVNSHTPSFEGLIATEVELELPPGWGEAEIVYPPHEMKVFGFMDEPLAVYEEQVVIQARFRVPEGTPYGTIPLTAKAIYQACNDSECIAPVSTQTQIDLVVAEGGESLVGDAAGAAGGTGGGLLFYLLSGILGGLILNVMPCVLPILSLKVFSLVKSAGGGRGAVVKSCLATAAGILVSFWALAAAAIAAKAAGAYVGWGVQFQNPIFVAILAVIIVLFSLNLWGVFEIPMPRFANRVQGSGSREGLSGHFFSGLFATLMATPCSAPFLGAAVGFGLAQPAGVILAIFTAVGVGMALPYLALALFPRAAAMLPKPGAWMEVVRGLMGFLLAGAAVWLLYVLSNQVSPERLAFFQVSLLLVALFTWLRSRSRAGSWMKPVALVGALGAMAAALTIAGGARAGESGPAKFESAKLIPWVEFDLAQAQNLTAEGRLVFVDVTADWCVTCKFNERLILETDEVAEAFARHGVVAMKADWTNRNDEIGAYLADFGRSGIPFYALYRPGEKPFVFSELLSKKVVLEAVESAAAAAASFEPTLEGLDGEIDEVTAALAAGI